MTTNNSFSVLQLLLRMLAPQSQRITIDELEAAMDVPFLLEEGIAGAMDTREDHVLSSTPETLSGTPIAGFPSPVPPCKSAPKQSVC